MFHYDADKLKAVFTAVIMVNVTPDTWSWLQNTANDPADFNSSFVLIPRKTGKSIIQVSKEQVDLVKAIRPGFSIEGWSIDRLCRVWLLLQLNTANKEQYQRVVENLFLAAEMNELVALYSSLPLLSYPEIWVKRCAEGIRSNIDTVLEAIMYHNPFPSESFDQAAWNQMILKAFFTNKKIRLIVGLDHKANKELAYTLADYARERWAAGRKVNPMLWRLVGRFTDIRLFDDIKKGWNNHDAAEKKAIALSISESTYGPAKALLNEEPELKLAIQNNVINWDAFEPAL